MQFDDFICLQAMNFGDSFEIRPEFAAVAHGNDSNVRLWQTCAPGAHLISPERSFHSGMIHLTWIKGHH
jgi:hypothetical protein